MRPWQVTCDFIEDAVWLSSLVVQLSALLCIAGGTSPLTCSGVMQIWVVIGAPPMPGMLMPRDFIIAMASGGICGMFAICMVVEIFQSPGLPWPAKAVAGMRTAAVTINLIAV